MTDHPTTEEVQASIVPKSDQLNADDLVTGPITVTITKVSRGDHEQPISVEIEGHRPYKPCKTMRRVMVATFTDDPSKWVGQRMTLFCDPDVMLCGVRVGGIRISHLTGLETPHTFLITTGRGKRTEVTIHPIAGMTSEEAEYIEVVRGELASVATVEELKAAGQLLSAKSKCVQDALRPVYAKRLKELRKGDS